MLYWPFVYSDVYRIDTAINPHSPLKVAKSPSAVPIWVHTNNGTVPPLQVRTPTLTYIRTIITDVADAAADTVMTNPSVRHTVLLYPRAGSVVVRIDRSVSWPNVVKGD